MIKGASVKCMTFTTVDQMLFEGHECEEVERLALIVSSLHYTIVTLVSVHADTNFIQSCSMNHIM